MPNARAQCEGVRVLVEYRLKNFQNKGKHWILIFSVFFHFDSNSIEDGRKTFGKLFTFGNLSDL